MNHLRRLIAATALGLLVSGPAAATLVEMTFDGVWSDAAGGFAVPEADSGDTYRATVRWDTAAAGFSPNQTYNESTLDSISGQLLFTPNISASVPIVLDSNDSGPALQSVLVVFTAGEVSSLQFSMFRAVGNDSALIDFFAEPTLTPQETKFQYALEGDPNRLAVLTATRAIGDGGYIVAGPVTVGVPEPTSVALMGLALAAFGFSRRRPS